MIKIKEKPGTFKRYAFLFLGAVWFLNGATHLWSFKSESHLILGVIFILLGITYFGMYYYYKETGFIAWTDTEIILSEWQRKKFKEYLVKDIGNITVTNSHFILNSISTTKGISFALKDFKEEDILLLKSKFPAQKNQDS